MEKWAVFLHDVYEFQISCLSILLSALQGDVLSSCRGTGTLSKALRRSCNSITWMFHCGVLSLSTKVSVTHADIRVCYTCWHTSYMFQDSGAAGGGPAAAGEASTDGERSAGLQQAGGLLVSGSGWGCVCSDRSWLELSFTCYYRFLALSTSFFFSKKLVSWVNRWSSSPLLVHYYSLRVSSNFSFNFI